jgi:dCTP deaminase
VGFCNYWTLEMSVKLPVRIYRGMPIGQLIYFEVSGPVAQGYDQKRSAKYRAVSKHPTASRMYLNFPAARRTRAAPVRRR